MSVTRILSVAAAVIGLLSLIVTIYYNWKSEAGKKPKVTGEFVLDEWPLITPVLHSMEHGPAKTYRLQLKLFNVSVPPRTLFLREATVRIWPRGLPFLASTYRLEEPLLGERIEQAHQTISPDSIETFRVDSDPFIRHFRRSRWPGRHIAEVSMVDATGCKHPIRIPISRRLASKLAGCSIMEEYCDLFRSDNEERN